jgi:hypothetical protein
VKACARCEETKGLSGFARWDAVCVDCREAQEEAERVARLTRSYRCARHMCSEELTYHGTGRPPKCCDPCRKIRKKGMERHYRRVKAIA